MAWGAGTRQWVRGLRTNIATSTVVLGQGEQMVDELGYQYGGDGVTQIQALSRAAKIDESRINVTHHGVGGGGGPPPPPPRGGGPPPPPPGKILYFPAIRGPNTTYLVTDSIYDSVRDGACTKGWAWSGERTERGTAVHFGNANYNAVTIKFRPVDTTKPLLRAYNLTSPTIAIGPFEHRNLRFDLGDAHGFIFGVQDPANPSQVISTNIVTVQDGLGQSYTFRTYFDNCALESTWGSRASVAEVLTRSGRVQISLTKSFEASLENVSLSGSDLQLDCYGCDVVAVKDVRSQGAHQPVRMRGSGTFTVANRINGLQIEGWTTTPLAIFGCGVQASNLRLEQNDGAPVGRGRFLLTETANVTQGSGVLTFSGPMTNILFPNESLIEFTDGTTTCRGLVTAVAGTSVTISTTTTFVTFTSAAATVTRIHGIGPLSTAAQGVVLTNVSYGSSPNCPAFVMVPSNAGSMTIVNAFGNPGLPANCSSWMLANIPQGGAAQQASMRFIGCDPIVCPDPAQPYVSVVGIRARYGWPPSGLEPNMRIPTRPLAESVAIVRRLWTFSPEDTAVMSAAPTASPIVQVADDSNTAQKPWCWHRIVNAGHVSLVDNTLPSSATALVRIRTRLAWDGVAGQSFTIAYEGNGVTVGSTFVLPGTAGVFQTFETVLSMPAAWQGAATGDGHRGISLTGVNWYCQGFTVEEITPGDRGVFPGGLQVPVKAGAPVDADYLYPAVGMVVLDTTNNKLWARTGAATWKGVVIA